MKNLEEDITNKEVKKLKQETIKMFEEEWTPKDFARELYAYTLLLNLCLSMEKEP